MPSLFISDAAFLIIAAILGAATSAAIADSVGWGQRSVILLAGVSFALFVGPMFCEVRPVSTWTCGAYLYLGGLVGEQLVRKILLTVRQSSLAKLLGLLLRPPGGPPA